MSSIFIVNALLARAWTLPEFGRFSAVWILGNTLAPVFLLGVPTALLYIFPRRSPGDPRRILVWQSTVVLSASACLLVALLWFAGGSISRWLSSPASTDLVIPFLPYVFSVVAAGHVEAALVASGRATWQAGLSLVGAVGLVAIAVLAYGLDWGIRETLWSLSAIGAGRCGVGWLALALSMGSPGTLSMSGVGTLLGYASRIGLNDAVGSLSRAVDRMVVLTFLGTADLALYHVGAIEVPVSLMLAAVVTVLVPEVSRLTAAGQLDAVAELFRGAVGRLALLILPLFFFLYVHAETVIELYLPAEYSRTTEVFRIFLLALPLRCAVYNPILVGTGRATWALYGSLGDLCVNVALSLFFVQALLPAHAQWALLGPAVATVLATWGQVAVLVTLLARSLGQSWRVVLPWARLGRVSVVSLLAAATSLSVTLGWQGSPALRLVIAAILFWVVVTALLWRWDRSDWDELIGLGRVLLRREGVS